MPSSKNYLLTLMTSFGPVLALGGVMAENDSDAIRRASDAMKDRLERGEIEADGTVIISSPDDREIERKTVAELAGR